MTATAVEIDGRTRRLARSLVEFLETGTPPDGLYSPDVFCDLTTPHWRQQAEGVDGVVGLRRSSHPGPSTVVRTRLDQTGSGFVLEFEERYEAQGGQWYARQLVRADIGDEGITQLSVYCTGDWDEARQALHRREVSLLRP